MYAPSYFSTEEQAGRLCEIQGMVLLRQERNAEKQRKVLCSLFMQECDSYLEWYRGCILYAL